MSLRKSPARTPSFMAAQRSNAQRSTGPRTPRGKARAALNALRHGRFAFRLAENLAQAGEQESESLYRWVLTKLTESFGATKPTGPGRPQQRAVAPAGGQGPAVRQDLARLARQGWCLNWNARRAAFCSSNPECALESTEKAFQHHPRRSLLQIQVTDRDYRTGISFWVRRRWRYSVARRIEAVLGPGKDPKALAWRTERGLRWRRFRPARPSWWQLTGQEEEVRRMWAELEKRYGREQNF